MEYVRHAELRDLCEVTVALLACSVDDTVSRRASATRFVLHLDQTTDLSPLESKAQTEVENQNAVASFVGHEKHDGMAVYDRAEAMW